MLKTSADLKTRDAINAIHSLAMNAARARELTEEQRDAVIAYAHVRVAHDRGLESLDSSYFGTVIPTTSEAVTQRRDAVIEKLGQSSGESVVEIINNAAKAQSFQIA